MLHLKMFQNIKFFFSFLSVYITSITNKYLLFTNVAIVATVHVPMRPCLIANITALNTR